MQSINRKQNNNCKDDNDRDNDSILWLAKPNDVEYK